jgi:hypothetical protein
MRFGGRWRVQRIFPDQAKAAWVDKISRHDADLLTLPSSHGTVTNYDKASTGVVFILVGLTRSTPAKVGSLQGAVLPRTSQHLYGDKEQFIGFYLLPKFVFNAFRSGIKQL